MKRENNVTITVGEEMSFMVLLHRVWKHHPVNVDFLGIYIPPENQFSPKTHGLIGKGCRMGGGNGGALGREFGSSLSDFIGVCLLMGKVWKGFK